MTDNAITDTAAPMRLRTEPPRVTRLSRKMLAGVGAVTLPGISSAPIYALQTRDAGPGGGELYSTENRPTADGLSGLPRDYTGPVLGPALPGDLGRPILDAQNRGQPVAPPVMATPAIHPEEERRRAEEEAARLSNVLFSSPAHARDRRQGRPCPALPVSASADSPRHRTGTRLSSMAPWTGRPSPRITSRRQLRPSSFRPGP